MAAPGWSQTGGIELAAQLLVVVDLTVEGNYVAAGGTDHGLVARWREIENRQALMGKGYSERRVLPGASRVGAAMGNRITHTSRHQRKIYRYVIYKGTQASDTAHQLPTLHPTTHQ